jgi:hypothetical protein
MSGCPLASHSLLQTLLHVPDKKARAREEARHSERALQLAPRYALKKAKYESLVI